MSDNTIPDAIFHDLEARLLSHPIPGVDLPADRIRKQNEGEAIPSPRLVILCGTPRPKTGMPGTARVPVMLQYITSQDAVTGDEHDARAGKLDAWLRNLGAVKRRDVIAEQIYLHDLYPAQAVKTLRKEDREQVTTIGGEIVVTLVDTSIV